MSLVLFSEPSQKNKFSEKSRNSQHYSEKPRRASQVARRPREALVDRCTVSAGSWNPRRRSPSRVKDAWWWRGGAVPALGRDQTDLSAGGSCKWRMMGAIGGEGSLKNCWQLDLGSLAWPRCSRPADGASLPAAGRRLTAWAWKHADVIMAAFPKKRCGSMRPHTCGALKKESDMKRKKGCVDGIIKNKIKKATPGVVWAEANRRQAE